MKSTWNDCLHRKGNAYQPFLTLHGPLIKCEKYWIITATAYLCVTIVKGVPYLIINGE